MSTLATAKVQAQFDNDPYPNNPIELSPKDNLNLLFIHALSVPYYLRYQETIDLAGKHILDVGCGSGYTTLVLAEANPGATIVGIDLSEKSIAIARDRLQYHSLPATFHAIPIEALPSLGQTFDFINCDETLYLLPDPVAGLVAMKEVLKPKGIIRANLHDRFNRGSHLRAQNLMRFLGLMDESPGSNECQTVREIMTGLKDGISLKQTTWTNPEDAEIKVNFLLQNDKGFSPTQLFTMLKAAGLEFIDMVDYATWDLATLFPETMPPIVADFAAQATTPEKLELFDLFYANHRLLDFWCGHPDPTLSKGQNFSITNRRFVVNPVLQSTKFKEALENAMEEQNSLPLREYFEHNIKPGITLSLIEVTCLYWLWEEPQTIATLGERWLKTYPYNSITAAPTTIGEAASLLEKALETLHDYLLLFTETIS